MLLDDEARTFGGDAAPAQADKPAHAEFIRKTKEGIPAAEIGIFG
jgi:hypothetical protein